VRFPCAHAAASTPVQRLGVILAHPPGRISLPRFGSWDEFDLKVLVRGARKTPAVSDPITIITGKISA